MVGNNRFLIKTCNVQSSHYLLSIQPANENSPKNSKSERKILISAAKYDYRVNIIPLLKKLSIYLRCENNAISNLASTSSKFNVLCVINLYRKFGRYSATINLGIMIDEDIIYYCKQLPYKFGIKLEYLSQIKCTFTIYNNSEYIATSILLLVCQPLFELTFSIVKEKVAQNQLLLDTLVEKGHVC
jgi:hypothetical protein